MTAAGTPWPAVDPATWSAYAAAADGPGDRKSVV